MNNKFVPFILPAIIVFTAIATVFVTIRAAWWFVTHPEVKLFMEAQWEAIGDAIGTVQYTYHNIQAYVLQLTVEPVVYDLDYFDEV